MAAKSLLCASSSGKMANMYDYLLWRGDLSFDASPLNEVDNLILSWLSYADWGDAVPPPGEGSVSLAKAAERFYETHPGADNPSGAYSINAQVTGGVMVGRAACQPRFGKMQLCGYVNEIDPAEQKQFSAVSLLWGAFAYVAYRGTDSTFVGWREDCNLSLSEAVPSQVRAAEYLSQVPQLAGRRIYVGGHSKGGNLAVYAGVKCGPEIAARIDTIFNNDGPGFTAHFTAGEDYRRMLPRIKTIIPQASVVGMLLEHSTEHLVVKSDQNGVLQHNGVHWNVLGTQFVRVKERTGSSQLFDKTMREWLAGLDENHRRGFINALFNILDATGATRIEELSAEGLGGLQRALRALGEMEEEQKRMLVRAVLSLIRIGNQTLYQSLLEPPAGLLREGRRKLSELFAGGNPPWGAKTDSSGTPSKKLE